jgi:hypothetical protein
MIETVNTIQMVDVNEIKSAPFNPRDRVERRALKKLLEDIRAIGFVMSPLLYSTIDDMLGDGHRRLACAKILGLTHVPVQYLPLTAAQIYALANNGSRPQGGQGWSTAAALGYPINDLPTQHRRLIEAWIEALGPEDFAEMAQRRSNDLVRVAQTLCRFVGETGPDALRVALLWLDKHNMSRPFIDAKRDGIATEAVKRAIADDRPLRQMWA